MLLLHCEQVGRQFKTFMGFKQFGLEMVIRILINGTGVDIQDLEDCFDETGLDDVFFTLHEEVGWMVECKT